VTGKEEANNGRKEDKIYLSALLTPYFGRRKATETFAQGSRERTEGGQISRRTGKARMLHGGKKRAPPAADSKKKKEAVLLEKKRGGRQFHKSPRTGG